MSQVLFQVDAFSAEPFAGNPAAVCRLDEERSPAWMQRVAREMNLSETAFLTPVGERKYGLRWFTPAVEVDLCGHATLAGAHVLWETGEIQRQQPVSFVTRSGELGASWTDGWIEMDFPADPPSEAQPPKGLDKALGADLRWYGRGRLYDFVLLADETTLRSLRPDFQWLRDALEIGVCVTAESDGDGDGDGIDFVSRFFAPAAGIDEDPVTGSAHCLLAPFWSQHLGKAELTGFQASERGGTVRVAQRADRVMVAGQAVTVARIELL